MGLFSIFKKTRHDGPIENYLKVDMHSHLIPGIDDGSESLEQSLDLIRGLQDLGFEKLVTTPHVMGDYFKNTPETILGGLENLRTAMAEAGINIPIEAAAEYYLDEWFPEKLHKKELLTFGNKYLLVETSYLNKPPNLEEMLFQIEVAGYKPILAHPERYVFLHDDFEEYEKLFDRKVLFQVNLMSFTGYYSPTVKKMADQLAEKGMVHFLGTDIHGQRHLPAIKRAMQTTGYRKLQEKGLLNGTLL